MTSYARGSTADQNPDHQIDALQRAGVARDDIYIDHASGAKASRPELDNVLRLLRDGDTLKITRLDRLGRSVLHLVTLGAQLRERGVGLHVIEQGIDTSTAEGRAMFGMLSVLAELQRELIVANTHDGLAAARARGRNGGRRAKLDAEQVTLAQQLYDAGENTVSRSQTSSECRAPPSTGTSTPRARASDPPSRTANPGRLALQPSGRRRHEDARSRSGNSRVVSADTSRTLHNGERSRFCQRIAHPLIASLAK
jgi:DNA invertase Pin-like site-specific DNA recombinase